MVSSVSLVLFLIIPKRLFERFSKLFEIDSLNLMCENLRKEKSIILKKKLNLMSNTLKTMQKDFKFLLVGKISREKACVELAQDVIGACCKKCENFKTCFLENINKRIMFERLVCKAIENKSISIDDVVLEGEYSLSRFHSQGQHPKSLGSRG